MSLKCCVMILKCCIYDFEKLSNDFEMFFFNDLSTSLNNFGSLKKTTKRGGGLRLPPPFVVLLAPKILRTAA